MRVQVARTRKITRVVITRSRKGNAELAAKLKARGFQSVSVDTIEFLPPEDWSGVDGSLRMLGGFDWLLFTSATGAEFFAQRMRALSLPVRWQGKPLVGVVGERTSAALRKEGIKVDFVPSAYLTRALAEELPRGRGKDVLVLRADIGEPEFVPTLERAGFRVTDLPIYTTSHLAESSGDAESATSGADAIIFASPSAVEAFMKRFDSSEAASSMAKKMLALCIGPVTAAAAKERGFERVLSAKTHTTDGVLQCLADAAETREGK